MAVGRCHVETVNTKPVSVFDIDVSSESPADEFRSLRLVSFHECRVQRSETMCRADLPAARIIKRNRVICTREIYKTDKKKAEFGSRAV